MKEPHMVSSRVAALTLFCPHGSVDKYEAQTINCAVGLPPTTKLVASALGTNVSGREEGDESVRLSRRKRDTKHASFGVIVFNHDFTVVHLNERVDEIQANSGAGAF